MRRTSLSLLLIFVFSVSTFSAVSPHNQQSRPLKQQAGNGSLNQGQAPGDRGWPRGYSLPSEAQVVLYQPQIASWDNQKHIVAFGAASYRAKDQKKPALGTVKIESDTDVSLEQRLVRFSTLKITESNFPTLSKEQAAELVAEVEKTIPQEDRMIALDRVLAYIDKSQIIPKNVEGLRADPPTIFLNRTPAILVSIDGDPIWSPIKDNELKFAVNTNWDLFQHAPTGLYYLRFEDTWLRSTDWKGPWSSANKLPDSFSKLPEDENWKEVKANLPGKPSAKAPTVHVSITPAELISIEGEPKYVPVPGTGLLWISNTESDLFRMGPNGAVYYLVAGRWFVAPNLNGNWKFATPDLPEDFSKISLEHPRSRVLASVPGTQQAAEALLLAQVPQVARVNKKEIKAPEVIYQGEPQFQLIDGTALQRAVNTDKDIVKHLNTYYMCYEGIWFFAPTPKGEWTVATSVPEEVYKIPPSSPSYNVTYVKVEDEDDSDDWVTYATYAGYTGLMIGWGCAVWGTGWYYPPYYYGGIYYPYWRTYGYAAWYNPYTGIYGTAGRIYGPYGGVGYGARYNSNTGTYARGAFAYGPYGARGAAQAYNPRTGTSLQTRQGSNVYGSWGSTSIQRGDDWANTKRFTNRQTGNTTRVTRGDDGGMISRKGQDGRGFVGAKNDNVYAGRDGNVYRRDQNGNWNKWENGSWNDVGRGDNGARDSMLNDNAKSRERQDRNRASQGDVNRGDRAGQGQVGNRGVDSSTMRSLDRDRASRNEGARRTRDSDTYRSRSNNSAGSYRGGGTSRGGGGGGFSRGGGGGGFRGGGGRR